MATPETRQQQGNERTKGQDMQRYGVLGILAGAVLGLVSGGGFAAAIKMALVGGGASAVGGAVAGDKLNPLFDKAMNLLPGRKNSQENGQGNAPSQQALSARRGTDPAQEQGRAEERIRSAQRLTSSIYELPPEQRDGAREMTQASMDSAARGMATGAQALSVSGAARPVVPTHNEGASRSVH